MATASEVKVELERGLRIFRAFENADKAVDYILSIEQNTKEAEAALAKVKSELETAKKDLVVAHAAVAAAKEEGKQAGAAARKRADDAVARGEKKAAELVQEAADKLAAANADAANKKVEAEHYQAQIVSGKAELEALEDKIAKAQAQIKKLLGG